MFPLPSSVLVCSFLVRCSFVFDLPVSHFVSHTSSLIVFLLPRSCNQYQWKIGCIPIDAKGHVFSLTLATIAEVVISQDQMGSPALSLLR